MTAIYRYWLEDSDLAVIEVSEDTAEDLRIEEWKSAAEFADEFDLPGDAEFATGRDPDGKRIRLVRVAK